MGDVIKKIRVRSTPRETARLLNVYFDTGSPRTFVKESVALPMKDIAELSYPRIFHGLGDGQFSSSYIIQLEFKLLDLWVPHLCYVVPDATLDPRYDILLGHDFMQIYDIRVHPKKKEVKIDKEAL